MQRLRTIRIPRRVPLWVPRRVPRLEELDTRNFILIIVGVALLLLLASTLFLNAFRQQRLLAQRNNTLLASWTGQLLTATPAALERQRLQEQLAVVQARFADASGRLPGTDVEAAILERINEAAERSGVTLTTLQQQGEPFQEGSLVGWLYEVGAEGDLTALTEFVTRLEDEAFPAAFVSDPTFSENGEGEYVMGGELTVYGSTLSTNPLVQTTPLSPEQRAQQLRTEAADALARGDYELALSRLLQLRAMEPGAADVDDLLYDVYVAYGDQLRTENRPDLAREQYESALAINPNGPEATRGLLEVAQGLTPTPGGIAVGPTVTATPTTFGGTDPDPFPPTTEPGFPTFSAPTSTPPSNVPPTLTRQPTSTVQRPTPGLPPTIEPPPQPATRTPAPPPVPPAPPPPQNPPTITRFPTTASTFFPSPTGTTTGTPGPSPTPSNTITPGPSPTPSNTGTPGPSPTSTNTAVPGTGAPPVSGTGPPSGIAFGPLTPTFLPNCGVTQIKGTIRDAGNGAPVNGAVVRVWWDGAGPDQQYSRPSGSDPSLGRGGWDVVLWPGPRAGRWFVAVADPGSGQIMSDIQIVETDEGPCQPGQSGRQVVIQDFNKFGVGPGEVQPLATPAPTPTPSITGTVTATPTGTRSPTVTGTITVTPTPTNTGTVSPTPTSSSTPTGSPTPTVTVTPTSTPYPPYYKDEDPDREIPDGPSGIITSTLSVPDAVILRQVRLFPNIAHGDAGDLVIDLIHPDGTTIRIHSQGQDAGQSGIRRIFEITGSDLERIRGRSAQGNWSLRVADTIEGQEGVLRSWSLEIFP